MLSLLTRSRVGLKAALASATVAQRAAHRREAAEFFFLCSASGSLFIDCDQEIKSYLYPSVNPLCLLRASVVNWQLDAAKLFTMLYEIA